MANTQSVHFFSCQRYCANERRTSTFAVVDALPVDLIRDMMQMMGDVLDVAKSKYNFMHTVRAIRFQNGARNA